MAAAIPQQGLRSAVTISWPQHMTVWVFIITANSSEKKLWTV